MTPSPLASALAVLLTDRKISTFLRREDPMAYRQAFRALVAEGTYTECCCRIDRDTYGETWLVPRYEESCDDCYGTGLVRVGSTLDNASKPT